MPTALTQTPGYISGDWSTPTRVSQTPKKFPFAHLGNLTDYYYTASYRQTLAKFTGTAAGTVNPEVAAEYLASESIPVPVFAGGRGLVAEFTRVYTTLPGTQTESKNDPISKPNPSTVGTTGLFFYANDGSTYLGAAVLYLGYLWGYNEVFGAYASFAGVNSGANWRATWTAHGLAGTETIALNATLGGVVWRRFTSGQYTVIDANTIDFLTLNLGAVSTYLAKKKRSYTPGSGIVRTQEAQAFWLAGVSGGITTDDDIPLPTQKLSDVDFLAAAIANLTGFVAYDAGQLDRWQGGKIRSRIATSINFADL